MAIPSPPARVTSSAVSSIVPGREPGLAVVERPVTYTAAPASPNPIAIPLPMPRVAPVTIATFPCNAPPMPLEILSELNLVAVRVEDVEQPHLARQLEDDPH